MLGIAAEIIEAGENNEANTAKILNMFRESLQHVRDTGIIKPDSHLHAVLRMISVSFKVDVQAIESINSLIRLLGMRCRAMTLELLNGRVMCKKTVQPVASMRTSWTNVKHHLSAIHDNCVSQTLDTKEFRKRLADLSSSCRFSVPRPFTKSDLTAKPLAEIPIGLTGAAWKWGKTIALDFFKACAKRWGRIYIFGRPWDPYSHT